MPLPRVLTVASWPALSSTMTVEMISGSLSRSPSSSTAARADTSSPSGCRRFVGDQAGGVVHELLRRPGRRRPAGRPTS